MDEALSTIVTAAQRGDLEAFSALVRRFQSAAYASAYVMLKDTQLAEDVTQEAFIEAYLKLSNLREPAAFPGWFHRIIIKQGDRLIRGKHLSVQPFEATPAFDIPLLELNPALIVERRETQRTVQAAIEALTERERVVIHLFYGTGYSLKDISTFLEVPLTTVKKRLFDARKQLKEKLMNIVQDILHEQQPYDERYPDKIQLLIAIRTGDLERVRMLIERDMRLVTMRLEWTPKGELFYYTSSIGYTALHEAASRGQVALVQLLLDYGANVNARSREGLTPLHNATLCNHVEVVRLLLKHDADPTLAPANGLTPLHWAVMRNYPEIILLLLTHGANVNARAVEGQTPLHWAALKNHSAALQLLLHYGADASSKNDHGSTAFDCAVARGYREIAESLHSNKITAKTCRG